MYDIIALAVVIAVAAFLIVRTSRPAPATPAYVAYQCAVHVCAMEYRSLITRQYSARQARANVRAYIRRHYAQYDDGERATLLRDAITHAQMQITKDNDSASRAARVN